MTDERMPTSGRLLEGSIAFIGCAVIVGMHGYMVGRSTLLRIRSTAGIAATAVRDTALTYAENRTERWAKQIGRHLDGLHLGELPDEWDQP